MTIAGNAIEKVLGALNEQLSWLGTEPLAIVVCGGAALNVLGFVDRPTRDIDVVALATGGGLEQTVLARPLPEQLQEAAQHVARDFALPDGWLNGGPTDLLRWGLPEGWRQRVVLRSYGSRLTVYYLGRLDLICLKLYAFADNSAEKHRSDLDALTPTCSELELAARWTRTHDPSPGFLQILQYALQELGSPDVAEQIT